VQCWTRYVLLSQKSHSSCNLPHFARPRFRHVPAFPDLPDISPQPADEEAAVFSVLLTVIPHPSLCSVAASVISVPSIFLLSALCVLSLLIRCPPPTPRIPLTSDKHLNLCPAGVSTSLHSLISSQTHKLHHISPASKTSDILRSWSPSIAMLSNVLFSFLPNKTYTVFEDASIS